MRYFLAWAVTIKYDYECSYLCEYCQHMLTVPAELKDLVDSASSLSTVLIHSDIHRVCFSVCFVLKVRASEWLLFTKTCPRGSLSLLLITGTECVREVMFSRGVGWRIARVVLRTEIAHQRLIKLMHTYCCQDLIKHAGEMHKDTKWHGMKRENINLSGKQISSRALIDSWKMEHGRCPAHSCCRLSTQEGAGAALQKGRGWSLWMLASYTGAGTCPQ